MTNLNKFYSDWANRPPDERDNEIQTCIEKSNAMMRLLKTANAGTIDSVLEVGCGFGRNLSEITARTGASYGLGCDISEGAIAFAQAHYGTPTVSFFQSSSLDIVKTVAEIRQRRVDPFDALLLFDVLEHVPNPKKIIRELAPLTRYFLIKLPIENSIFDNYLLPRKKVYPSVLHPDGHLREFHVNNVHQFVVSLGLVPIAYDFYRYKQSLLFPRYNLPRHFLGRTYFEMQNAVKCIARLVLPKRLFLRIMGGGGFVCIATWSEEAVFE